LVLVFGLAVDAVLELGFEVVWMRGYRALNLRSYARFDLRITTGGQVYVVEPNVNPCLARDDELAQSALKAGIGYPNLIRKLVNQALRRKA
jgi:D-alanine-D-alanine ligase